MAVEPGAARTGTPLDRMPAPLAVGVVVWLASELMFFAGLFAAYFTLRAGTGPRGWPPAGVELEVGRTAVATGLLVLSSVTLHVAVRALRSEPLHAAVHLHFLVSGCAFVWPLVGLDPLPRGIPHAARLGSVILAVPFHAVLGLAIMSASTPLAPRAYPSLSDQQAAGAIGWAAGEVFAFALVALAFVQWLAADRRQAGRLDRAQA